jgi:hypothetical protein
VQLSAGPEGEIGGPLANLVTVGVSLFNSFAKVETNKDARIRILGRRLGKAVIPAEHG